MVLFDKDGKIRRYRDEVEIMEEFYFERLKTYGLRKNYQISKIQRDIVFLENKLKFIIYVNEEKLILRNRKKKDVVQKLIEFKFTKESEMPSV